LPQTIVSLVNSALSGDNKLEILGWRSPFTSEGLWFALLIIAAVLLVTVIVVKLNEAARNLTIHYAKRVQGNRAYGGVTTRLPIKLITAGVIPIIFAVAFLSVPSFVGQLLTSSSNTSWQELGINLVTWFQPPTSQSFAAGGWQPFIYPLAYFFLVFVFTFFYTSITFNAQE